MNIDDIIYLSLLIFSIGFGHFYKQIEDKKQRKYIGCLVGLLIVIVVSGFHVLHPIFVTFVNAFIILFVDKRKCHIVSFFFSFLYLFFFRMSEFFGIPYAPAHCNLIQMILTLKLVGLAFEVNSAHESKKKKDNAEKTEEEKLEDEMCELKVDFEEIFLYAFNYIGVLTGPYYRYRTYKDYFDPPFSKYANWKDITVYKLKFVPLYGALFLFGTYNWPLSYALSDEFYTERSWLYRYWYVWPSFFIFRMRIYIGLVLSECVCTVAGLGAYPTISNPKCGHGPSENFAKLKELKADEKQLESSEYNFETIRNVSPYGSDFCTTYREGMKHWNICVQYWLAVNVYKRFPSKSKQVKTIITTLVSAVWHGVYAGYYVCIGTVPMVLAVEDVWVKLRLKNNSGISLKIWEWIVWFFKMHHFSYQGMAFHLLELRLIYKYYSSVYHCGLILWFVLLVGGMQLLKQEKSKSKRLKRENDNEQSIEQNKIK